MTVAVRPEDIAVYTEPPTEGAEEFRVYAVLSAGPEHIVQAVRNGTTVAARTFTRPELSPDQPVWLIADTAREPNVYDRVTGERVETRPAPATTPLDSRDARGHQQKVGK